MWACSFASGKLADYAQDKIALDKIWQIRQYIQSVLYVLRLGAVLEGESREAREEEEEEAKAW